MARDTFFEKSFRDGLWPPGIRRAVEIGETGLVLGKRTLLVRMERFGARLALDTDRERLLALLCVAYNDAVPADVLIPIEAAAKYWHRGDKALANFRLVFSDLPHLRDPSDAYRLNLAETLLDQGLSPRGLMKKLNLDPAPLDLRKYSSDQPRVPAGNGRDSGRWGFEPSGQGLIRPRDLVISRFEPRRIKIAANGPLKPDGQDFVTLDHENPMDSEGLNVPLSPEELQAIAKTLNTTLAGTAQEIKKTQPAFLPELTTLCDRRRFATDCCGL